MSFFSDEILKGNIKTTNVPSHAQLAYIFTKALGKRQFDYFHRKLDICMLQLEGMVRGIIGYFRKLRNYISGLGDYFVLDITVDT